jgi:micrococcal nuclease
MELYTYKVANCRVVDGDTLEVTLDLGFSTFRKEKLRLARVNAPELKTANGLASKAYLSDLLNDKVITIQTKKDAKDRYGRYIAEVWVIETLSPDASKILNVNDKLLTSGMASPYI